MKLHYLLFVFILMATACKKKEKVIPAPTPPTKDFREKYTGVFNITSIHWSISHPSGMPRTRSSYMSTGTVQVSYKITDSIHNLSRGYPGYMQAALSLVYGNGTSKLIGIDTLGKLYANPIPPSGNYGGFITADSIFHVYGDTYTSSSSEDTLYGKRVK